MIAARLYGPGRLAVEEIETPRINENEVLVKVTAAAVCGTDLRMYRNGFAGVDESHPRVLGHEFGGVVAQVGKNVECFTEGMEVALAPNIGCGVCERCAAGNGHLCDAYTAFGINIDGAFAEYVKVPERAVKSGNLMATPKGLSAEDVALNEPLSCGGGGSFPRQTRKTIRRRESNHDGSVAGAAQAVQRYRAGNRHVPRRGAARVRNGYDGRQRCGRMRHSLSVPRCAKGFLRADGLRGQGELFWRLAKGQADRAVEYESCPLQAAHHNGDNAGKHLPFQKNIGIYWRRAD